MRAPALVAHSLPVGSPLHPRQFTSAGSGPLVDMATTRNSWGNRSGPNSPRSASTFPGEQEAAKAAVLDEAALLAEDLCTASPQHGADRFSADRLVPQWRSAGSFASGSRSASAPPSRRSPVSDGELAALQLRLQLAEAQERTSRVQLKIEQAHVVQQQKRHEASLPFCPLRTRALVCASLRCAPREGARH